MFEVLMISIQRMLRRSILCLFLGVFLSSCTTSQNKSNLSIIDIQSFYLDQQFTGYAEVTIESADEVFAIDAEMRQVVEQELLPIRDYKKRATQLLQHLFSKNNVNLAYQNAANLTAIQSYHSQEANCMSLTILAFALAKEADLQVKFQQLQVPEYWVRDGNYNLLAGHVNLMITNPKKPSIFNFVGNDVLEIDFDPFIAKTNFPKNIINQNTVLAMYYNNKGAQRLIQKKHLEAYAYIREATRADPAFSPSWSNLGILYRLSGNLGVSNQVYRHAITLDTNNLAAFSNLSLLLAEQGYVEEANAINKRLLAKRSRNPYYQALLANDAFLNGELQKSLQLYRKAIRLDSNVHQFYYRMAMVYFKLAEWSNAESAIKKALASSPIEATEKQYMAVLDSIKTQQKAL